MYKFLIEVINRMLTVWLNATKEMVVETGLACKGLVTTLAR
jgi:hypothetical protein